MAEAPGTFGELVYEQRRRLRMGRARLAAMVGHSPDAVTRWEKAGVAPRDAATLEELAKALKLEPSRLAELAERARADSREVPIVASPPPVPYPRPARPVAPPLTAPVEGAPAASFEETAVPPVLPVPPAVPAPAQVREPIRRAVVPEPARPGAATVAPRPSGPAYQPAAGTMVVVEIPPSYRDDPHERRLYLWRYALTALALLVMAILLAWAARELWGALVTAKESLSQ